MTALSRGVVALAVAAFLAAPALHAQSAEFSLGGGLGVPLGSFDDVVKIGWQGTAAVSFRPANLPVGIQVDGNYSQFSDESPLDIKDRLIYGTANAVYRFESSEGTRFHPYLIGGLGLYNSKETGSDALGGSSTKFGINVGAGFDFKAGSAGLFIEGRFHDVFTDGPNVKFIPLNVGVRFGGA
jgi:outer membrane protein with beta-barrel domain